MLISRSHFPHDPSTWNQGAWIQPSSACLVFPFNIYFQGEVSWTMQLYTSLEELFVSLCCLTPRGCLLNTASTCNNSSRFPSLPAQKCYKEDPNIHRMSVCLSPILVLKSQQSLDWKGLKDHLIPWVGTPSPCPGCPIPLGLISKWKYQNLSILSQSAQILVLVLERQG